MTTNTSSRGSIFCVYAKSENPETALRFIEAWNTTPEIKNLLCYGVEGRHYTLEDGKVKQVDGISDIYSSQNWTTGNMFISYLLIGEPDDKYEQYLKFNEQAVASLCLGFTPDLTEVNDKYASCKAAFKEYGILLSMGCVDPDEYLKSFRDALTAAGVEDVVKEIQAQYTAWKADSQE